MNPEIAQLRAKIAESKNRLTGLDMEASNCIITIKNLINPYEDDITLLETEQALVALNRLDSIKKEMIELRTKVAKLEKDLGA